MKDPSCSWAGAAVALRKPSLGEPLGLLLCLYLFRVRLKGVAAAAAKDARQRNRVLDDRLGLPAIALSEPETEAARARLGLVIADTLM